MGITIVVILVEAAHDLSLVSPLMLSIFISHIVSTTINHHSYDEKLILRKGVPFLDAELPQEMDSHSIVAADLCEVLPLEAMLPPEAPVRVVQLALEQCQVLDFPVIQDGMCIGLTTRTRLEAAMRACGAHLSKDDASIRLLDDTEDLDQSEDDDELICYLGSPIGTPTVASAKIGQDMGAVEEAMLAVYSFMDPAPHTLLEDMPVPRLYPLFAKTGTCVAVVVSRRGEFRGLLSRVNLISAASAALRPKKTKRSR